MSNAWERTLLWLVYLAVSTLFGLLLALPFKWCWNYAMPYTFGLPYIGWGHAFCLTWVLVYLKTTVVTHESSK